MTTLLAVEIRRFTSRRLMRVLALLLALGFVAAGAIAFAKSNRDVASATARARADAVAEYEGCRQEAGPSAGLCKRPDIEQITAEPRFRLTTTTGVAAGVSGLLMLIGLVAGASFAGADWNHRVIATTLTWEPRRERVLLAKVLAAALVTFGTAVALELLLVATLTPAAVWRGTTAGTSIAWFGDLAGTVVRGSAAAGLAAAIGCAVAMIGRATAAALGLLFAWTAVAENAIRGGIPGWRRWLVTENVGAFVTWGDAEFVRSGLTAGLLLVAYAAAALAFSARVFSRRDVA